MKNVILAEPATLALFGLLLMLAVLAVISLVAVLAFLLLRKTRSAGPSSQPPIKPFDKTTACPKCGAPLPADSPEGLCPRCLVAMNLATQTEIVGQASSLSTRSPKPSPAPPLPVADVAKLFPQLEILECLGRGGMGAVYKARQPRLDRIVALKILSPEKQGNQKFADRFEREARALAKLHHPNIVTVYDFGEARGNFYLLMEFVDGLTLRQLLQARKLSPPEALAIVPKICDALQYAHGQGIVHRDIKPENILMDKEGRVKIADFGIAKILGDGAGENLTAEQVIGTPHYMSPEQIEKPQTVDHRADIYSLGVVFYEMLTGELPLGKFQPPSRKVHVDVRLDEVVLRALEKEPDRRYQQASEVKTRVETIAATSSRGSGHESAQTESQNRQTVTATNARPRFSRAAVVVGMWIVVIGGVLAFILAHHHITTSNRVTLTEAAFLQKFNSNQIDHATIMYPHRGGGVASISGKYFETNTNGKPVIAEFVVPAVVLTPTLENKLLPSGKIFVIIRNPTISEIGYSVLLFCIYGLVILFVLSVLVIIIFVVWRALRKPVGTFALPVQKPDHFWRWFAVTVLALVSIPFLIAIFGLFAAIAIPNFVKARQHALAQHDHLIASRTTNSPSASTETWSPTLAPGEKPDFQKILNSANSLMDEGSYEEALQHYLWYFDHSRNDAGQRGVRLSFALSDWIELGRRYPKARQALIEIRDADMRQFSENGGYTDLFQEIARVNQYLNDDNATVALFKTIEKHDPQLAGQCFLFAEYLLVQKGEYETCRKYLGDPQEAFERIRQQWQQMKQFERQNTVRNEQQKERFQAMSKSNSLFAHAPVFPTPPPFADNNFVQQTRQLIEILMATDDKSDAKNIQKQALALLDDSRLKSAVNDAVTNAITAARAWLALNDKGNYSESWNEASAIFRETVTEAAWENSMNTFRKPMGDLISRKLISAQPMTQLPGVPDGHYVVMQFETSFANKKPAIETVTFTLETNGQWKASGYYIK